MILAAFALLTALPQSDTLVPVAERTLLGRFIGGTLASWAYDDHDARTVEQFFLLNDSSGFCRLDLDFKSANFFPSNIELRVKVAAHTPRRATIILRVFDYVNNGFVNTNVNSINIVDGTTYVATPPPPLGRYTRLDGLMTVRVEVKQLGLKLKARPTVSFELANLVVD